MINKLFDRFGLQIVRKKEALIPKDFLKKYYRDLKKLQEKSCEFEIFEFLHYDIGTHPHNHVDFECEFSAKHVSKTKPETILDIGSYRHFILGLLSHYKVATIDIRERKPFIDNEIVITCDAKKIDADDNSYDVVLSLCALEHFGLGRYGDDFDINADKTAFQEFIRVLKPNGYLVFSTTITNASPSIGFNGCRIYNYKMIQNFCNGWTCVDEMFWSHKNQRCCKLDEVTTEKRVYDIYCGCWQKK